MALWPVERLHCVLTPLHRVVLTYGGGVDNLHEFCDELRHRTRLVGIDVGDIGESMGEHGAAVDGPFALILQPDDGGDLIDELLGRGDDLFHQPVGSFEDVVALLLPRAVFAAHAEILLRASFEVKGQGSHPFHGRPTRLEVAEVEEFGEFGVHGKRISSILHF